MIRVDAVTAVRAQVGEWRQEGLRVCLVPTMGNLHGGHLKLVDRARKTSDRVVVSIFVNPLQFGVGEDFDAYPRTMEEDERKLREHGVDLLFNPGVAEMYSHPPETQTRVEVPGLSDILCGASRPGHFVGVGCRTGYLFRHCLFAEWQCFCAF